ncbi:hypothetical protein KFU94_05640 [Chloroflexi bacterium TSY]|nr:hypothetical protein [Chloroflexi bacterium TSY]
MAISLATWNVAFSLGAYNTIFFDRLFAIWVVNLAVLLACLFVPGKERPVSGWGLVALATPTIWLILGVIQIQQQQWTWVDTLLYFASIVLMIVCLPYVVYVMVSLTQEQTLAIKPRRLLYALVTVAIIMSLLGYLMGAYNELMMTCRDFEVAGWFKPVNCYEGELPITPFD